MFDKKYIAGIASFAGAAINNVKAAADTNVFVNIGGTIYSESDKGKVEKSKLLNLDGLISELVKLTGENVLKNGSVSAKPLDLAKISEEYFVKSVKVGNTEKFADEKLADISTATIDGDNKLTVELVPKRECIKFKYTGAKQLTTANEDELLKLIVQGKTLKGVKDDGLLGGDYTNHKLGGVGLTDDTVGNEVGGNVIKLFGNNMCELVIDSDKIQVGKFKTFILNLDEEVIKSLVNGLVLHNFDALVPGNIISDNKGTTALKELNKVQVTSADTDKDFFKGKFEILKEGDVNVKIATDGDTVVSNFNNGSFYVLKDIKKENINAKYLKKTFKVEFDSTDTSKEVQTDKINDLINALNENFKDSLTLSSKAICDFLKTKKGIIKNGFTGNIKIGKGNNTPVEIAHDKTDELVDTDTTEFVIKLPETVFDEGVVETKIAITCSLDNVKKGDKVLTGDVKNIILPILNKTLTEVIAIKGIIDALNAALSGKFENDSKKIEAIDFDFSAVSSDNTNIKNSGAITIKASFVNKLKDDCFDNKEAQPEPSKDSDSKGTNGDGGNQNEGNKDQKGYCGSNKK